tara:strand:- start:1639 stop:2382 length:744 start_codon:yes stop_codon:yes gene_type:complete
MIPDLSYLELLIIIGAFVFGGLCKGISGVGVPIIAVPVIAAVTDITLAIVLIAIPSVVPNIYQVWKYRDSWNRQFPLAPLSILSVFGSGLGIFVLLNVESKFLARILGCIVTIYIISGRLNPFYLGDSNTKLLAAPVGFLSGLAGGTTGVSAPVILMYLTALKLSRETFIFSVSVYFIAMGSGQFVWLSVSHLMTWEFVFLGILSLAPIAFGMWLGDHIGKRIPEDKFNTFLHLFLLTLGVKLMVFS